MKPATYRQFRREYIRLKSLTIYERLLHDADARRRAIVEAFRPVFTSQLVDREYETTPEERRLRPVEYAAFPYRDKRYDYTPSNTAGTQEALGWCYSGKHRVPVSELYVKGKPMALACPICQARKANERKMAYPSLRTA